VAEAPKRPETGRSHLPLIYVNGAFCPDRPYAGNKAA
jgi:hypothetical protein